MLSLGRPRQLEFARPSTGENAAKERTLEVCRGASSIQQTTCIYVRKCWELGKALLERIKGIHTKPEIEPIPTSQTGISQNS